MKQKTEEHHKINALIKKINSEMNVFTAYDFQKNEDLVKLQEYLSINGFEEIKKLGETKKLSLIDILEQNEKVELKKKTQQLKVAKKDLDEDTLTQLTNDFDSIAQSFHQRQDIDATAKFFGIPNKHLDNKKFLTKLSNPIYYEVINITKNASEITKNIDGEQVTSTFKYDMEKINYYKENIEHWVQYCKRINSYKTYINQKYTRWGKYTNKEKKELINTFKELLHAPFISDISNLEEFIYFIENYTLNQTKKAKAQKLLDYKFKNVDDIKTATKIIEISGLIK